MNNQDLKLLDPKIKEKFEQVLLKNGIVGEKFYAYTSIGKMDGFVGLITRIVVENASVCGKVKDKPLCLVIKSEPTSVQKRENYKTKMLFEREIGIYESYIPELREFIKKKMKSTSENEELIESFTKSVKYFGTIVIDDCLKMVMEDMKEYGFKMALKPNNLDSKWCEAILERLAKYHGSSFAFRDQEPEKYDKFVKSFPVNFFKTPFPGFIKLMDMKVAEAIQDISQCFEASSIDLTKLKKFGDNPYGTLYEMLDQVTEEDKGIIIHGDCWTNNMLFKYTQNEIEQVCLLDFQGSHLGSPVLDISTFIFVCCHLENPEKIHWYLDFYYTRLAHWITTLGSNPDHVYSRSTFEDHIKRFSKMGFAFCCVFWIVFENDPADIPDVHTSEAANGDLFETFGKMVCKNKEPIRAHLKPIVQYLIENSCL